MELAEAGWRNARASVVRGMDVVYISALSALAGSIIGGLTSSPTWMNQRAEARAARLAYDLSRQEELFRFHRSASKHIPDDPEQRAANSGFRRPLRHDQQDACLVRTANGGVRRESYRGDDRCLFRTEQNDCRCARAHKERGRDRSIERVLRGCREELQQFSFC